MKVFAVLVILVLFTGLRILGHFALTENLINGALIKWMSWLALGIFVNLIILGRLIYGSRPNDGATLR